MSLAENLRKARVSSGLTQQQVADALEITKSTYSGYEIGRREPDALKLKKISKLLNVSGDALLETGLGESAVDKKKSCCETLLSETQQLSGKDIIARFITTAGFVNADEPLSEDDYKILNNVVDILETWFRQKKKK